MSRTKVLHLPTSVPPFPCQSIAEVIAEQQRQRKQMTARTQLRIQAILEQTKKGKV